MKNKIFSAILLAFFTTVLFSQLPHNSIFHLQYYLLSESLTKGKLDVTEQIKKIYLSRGLEKRIFDYALYQDQYFVYLGIFPAIFGIIFLPLGPSYYLTLTNLVFFILTALFLYQFTKHFLKNAEALLIALLLFIVSPLLTTIAFRGPWYTTGLISFCFGLIYLWFLVIKKKSWGVFLFLPLFLTRPTTLFYLIIPYYQIIKFGLKKAKRLAIYTAITTLLSFAIFGSYNYLRFDDPFEAGYKYALWTQEAFTKYTKVEKNYQVNYFTSNLIYTFINPPRVHINKALRFTFPYFELSRFGVGLLYASPWLLPYFFLKKNKKNDLTFLAAASLNLMAILYFGSAGSFQISSRYACDYLPLIFFVNLHWLSQEKNKFKKKLFYKLFYFSIFPNLYFFFLIHLGHIRRF